MAVRPIDGTWSKFVWNLGEKSESLARKFREGKACFIDLRLAVDAQPTLTHSNEPLTLKELRQMDGKPVWVENVDHWALIDIEKGGEWDSVPFAVWTENGVDFCYNVMDRNLLCYRRPPEGEKK